MGKLVSAFSNDALGTLDAVGIAAAIAKGEISAAEAAEAAIARAEKVNGELNAIAFKMYDSARDQVNTTKGGDLFGVPAFVKDNENIKGYPTQLGTKAFLSKPAKKNSKFANQFLSTGLNLLGKTTLPEFGIICSTENERWGITRNPWNTDYTTGGSSSGSAAMVASGVVPIAQANDGAGSTRIPASCCGLVGLKPSRNRLVNLDAAGLLPLNIVYQGVLTRSVRDTAAFYASAEKHFSHPKLPKMGLIEHANKKRMKIAFFDNVEEGKYGHLDNDTYNTLENTARLLRSLGHEVDLLPFPLDIAEMADHFLHYYGFLSYAMSNWGGLVFQAKVDKSQLEIFTNGLSNKFSKQPFKLPRSLKTLKKAGRDVEQLFGQYDILMSPVLAHKITKIGYFSEDLPYEEMTRRLLSFAPYTGLQNISGAPAISLPLGTCSDGLPIGVQFVAPYGMDKKLIELAYELEEAQPWKFIYNSEANTTN